ncbi:hypothetical protein ON003_00360 [Janibacter hoylei]|nr:hypothetical protein [Janibacter hoylei]MCW4600235.1 hypothetical protein [Janibacter hoylei]
MLRYRVATLTDQVDVDRDHAGAQMAHNRGYPASAHHLQPRRQ